MKFKIDEKIKQQESELLSKLQEIKNNPDIQMSEEEAKKFYNSCFDLSKYYKQYQEFLVDFEKALNKILEEKKTFLKQFGIDYDKDMEKIKQQRQEEEEQRKKNDPFYQLRQKYPNFFN